MVAKSMPGWLREKLLTIPHPSNSLIDLGIESITYHPAAAVTKDGATHECVVFFGETAYRRVWGPDPKRKMIDIEYVRDVRPSRLQLPPKFADRLYVVGETRMGGVDFKLKMKDGKDFYYITGNLVDFIDYPEGYSGSDIAEVQTFPLAGFAGVPSASRPGHLGGHAYDWCLYAETDDELNGIKSAQPGWFTGKLTTRFGSPRGSK